MRGPLVSILVPIYGVEKYIERCAISLFEQTYENIEYIFVDDCTPDGSVDILKEVILRYPNRKNAVRIIHHENNRGLAAARNTAISFANGDFVQHVDSDDYDDITAIEKAIVKQMECDADIVVFDIICITPRGKRILRCPKVTKDLFLVKNHNVVPFFQPATLIRKSLYSDFNIKAMEGVNVGEDFQTTSKLSIFAKNVAYIEEPLYFYDQTNLGSYTNSFSLNKYEQALKSVDVVKELAATLSKEYYESYLRRRASVCRTHMRLLLLTHSDLSKEYSIVKNEYNKVPFKCRSSLLLRHRVMFLLPSYTLSKMYMRLVEWVGRNIMKS